MLGIGSCLVVHTPSLRRAGCCPYYEQRTSQADNIQNPETVRTTPLNTTWWHDEGSSSEYKYETGGDAGLYAYAEQSTFYVNYDFALDVLGPTRVWHYIATMADLNGGGAHFVVGDWNDYGYYSPLIYTSWDYISNDLQCYFS